MNEHRINPGFEGGMAWLNVDRPIRMEELRGCVVVVDFWTYCCVNCMHVLPVLRTLEERFAGQPLVVIGVHSGKFTAERDPERILQAVGRYGVPHPVVVDDEMVIWSRFGIRSWPTLVIIRPDGSVASVAPGEPDLETLHAFVQREMDQARERGMLASAPPAIVPAPPPRNRPLNYPGKVSLLPDGRLVVSDSGHHRVLICSSEGRVEHCVGSGLRGLEDGGFDQAAFDDPQGTCWFDGSVYVADARNHALRRVDLERRTVTTVAGTGVLGPTAPDQADAATSTALRSPWDLCAVGDVIYVAMAGNHQIWRYHPSNGSMDVYAGTAVEALIDGPVATSAWAQPSGLSERRGVLYVADSETSAVRAIDLSTDRVRTLVGQGLFDFGDDEGDASAAMLQHCLDVAALDGGVLIADTYNGKIKLWTEEVGTEPARVGTVAAGLSEPGSIAVADDGAWYVADTNAHCIIRILAGIETTIEVQGAPEPKVGALRPASEPTAPAESVAGWFTTLLELPEGCGLQAGDGSVTLVLRAPEGMELSAGAPVAVDLEVSRRSDLLLLARDRVTVAARGGATQLVAADVRVAPVEQGPIEAELLVAVRYVTCDSGDHAACYPGSARVRVPVRLMEGAADRELQFDVPLPLPEGA
ncbi:MAG: redoxin domain-containing protein [Deltaproteobacteria bacterium]|jgi:thiol-disulfide isomerase/thioredoxin|nr:redoxin domain-containing protein [Deltaproteobacteria bacterium]MBW2535249.1 redoxin domain-containing protein [Deltaproteobacteria bacterium]